MSISRGYDDDTLKKLQNVQTDILKKFIKFCNENNLTYFMVFGSALGTVRHQGSIPWDDDIDVAMLRDDYEKFLDLFQKKGIKGLELMTTEINKNYATRVTHLQKKDTTFISEYSKDLKCHLGINIDIFVYDKVSNNEKIRNKQFRKTYIYGKLLFLRGTANPNINQSGLFGRILKCMCKILHCLMLILFPNPQKLYKLFQKNCALSNDENSNLYCCYGDYLTNKGTTHIDDLLPVIEAEYEGIKVSLLRNPQKHLEIYYGKNYMQLPPKDQQINHFPYKIDFYK